MNRDHTIPPTRLLTRSETAERLATTERHVRRLIENNELPAVRLGGYIRVRPTDLEDFIANLDLRESRPRSRSSAARDRRAAVQEAESLATRPIAPRPVKSK